MNNPNMTLGAANVAGVFEGDPGVPRLEQHGEHLAPEGGGLDRPKEPNLSSGSLLLVANVGRFELPAVLVVKVGHIGGRKECPGAIFHDPLHEEVWDPVGRVHVVGAAAVVASVLAQL